MAYIAFDMDSASAALAACEKNGALVDFTRQEWLAIEMARRDGIRAAQPGRRLTRFLHVLLGTRLANPLADPRLETLRQAAAHLWHRMPTLDRKHAASLQTQGFDACQVALLTHFIANGKHRTA